MSHEYIIDKVNLEAYLKALGKTFRKLNGTKTPAEIIIVGGASILINYGFRGMTSDIDAIIQASSAMKEAINIVRDEMGLPNG
jgi:predicted nucleotidyltransferase